VSGEGFRVLTVLHSDKMSLFDCVKAQPEPEPEPEPAPKPRKKKIRVLSVWRFSPC